MILPSASGEQPGTAWQPDVLIRTKLYIPQVRPHLVPRPALIARLDEGLARKLTLISAPAGFGKTTLLSEWIAASRVPVAWVSLDPRDNDPLRFGAYVNAALSTLELGLGRSGAKAGPGAVPPSLEASLARLINQAAEAHDDFVLVLDDYHVLTAEAIHSAVSLLLDHLPPQMHLVLTCRADPPLPLAQLRARDQLVELRAPDLRFTTAEVRAFLRQTMRLDLPDEAVATVDARSEGWVAGLQLAALALRTALPADNRAAWPEFVRQFTGTHRYIVDYLAEQVLLQQTEPVQTFLLETSILERLCGPLCDAVLGAEDEEPASAAADVPNVRQTSAAGSQAVLEHLEHANLFLAPLDSRREWYRYHPLFADFLQARLQQTRPERWAELHRRAAAWCRKNNLPEEAVRHALRAQDYELATTLIEEVAETLWARSQTLLMLSWMQAMPDELVRAQPRLCLQMAWALAISGQLDEVEPYVQAAEAGLTDQAAPAELPQDERDWHHTAHRVRVQADILRGFVPRFRGDWAATLAHCQAALDATPGQYLRSRSVILHMLGHGYILKGDVQTAAETLEAARATSLASQHLAVFLSATNYLALLRVVRGQLREAEALYREAADLVERSGEPSYSGIERIGLGTVLRERNDLDAADRLIEAGLRVAEVGGDFTFLRDGYIARARLDQALGQWERALHFADKTEQVARRSSRNRDLDLIQAFRARLHLAQDNLPAAEAWAAASGLAADDAPGFLNEYGHLTLARVLLAQGRLAEAERLLGHLLSGAEAAGRIGRAIEILAVQALVLQAQGESGTALAQLRRALALAEPEGFVRVFLDEGTAMTALLAALWQAPDTAGASAAYLAQLLQAAGVTLTAARRPAAKTTVPRSAALTAPAEQRVVLDPLSERERDILRLIVAGLSNHDIAAELVVAQSTIHWHIKNIYSKLNVHSRTQAALVARELGLVA